MTSVTDVSTPVGADVHTLSGAPVVFDNLTRRFGATTALDRFSLNIAPGELVALLGPSGCGKTTALRVLAGFERPDSGRILVDEKDVSTVAAQHRNMGMVFQSYSLFPNMNARDNVAFGLHIRHQRSSQRRAKAAELLDLVGLGEHVSKYPHQLSGGQQQRVALARALAIEPRVLLLDEPLSALDAKVRAELRDQIRAIQQRLAITTVFVTHDQEEAMSMADRVCVMSRGHLEQVATPAVLYSQPATPFVGQFVGVSSRISVTRRGDHVEILGREVKIRGDLSAVPTGELEALVRPEDLDVAVNPTGLGVITHRSFLGATTRVGVGVAGANLRADVRSSLADDLDVGTRVDVSVNARDVLVAASQPAS
ncbi:MAG: spermidine/putrescine transporter ATP-binding protein [Acidimicrobiaceae bacterium]|nr:spermidine/putrescine transporter ATP-binding protein [Acidimicrobiaceae bacterium]